MPDDPTENAILSVVNAAVIQSASVASVATLISVTPENSGI